MGLHLKEGTVHPLLLQGGPWYVNDGQRATNRQIFSLNKIDSTYCCITTLCLMCTILDAKDHIVLSQLSKWNSSDWTLDANGPCSFLSLRKSWGIGLLCQP